MEREEDVEDNPDLMDTWAPESSASPILKRIEPTDDEVDSPLRSRTLPLSPSEFLLLICTSSPPLSDEPL